MSNNPFKVGDVVRRIGDNQDGMEVGDLGVVTRIRPNAQCGMTVMVKRTGKDADFIYYKKIELYKSSLCGIKKNGYKK